MRLAALSGAFVLGLGLMLVAGTDARSAALIGVGAMGGAPSEPIVKVGEKKEQKLLNKACGPGKVFVEGKGCVKREKKKKAKDKTEPKPPPPTPTPPPAKQHCETIKAGDKSPAVSFRLAKLCSSGVKPICTKQANGDSKCCCPQ